MAKPAKIKEEAVQYFSEGKWDKALQSYNILTKLEPNDPKHIHKVGDLQAKTGRPKDAIDTYKKACEVYMAKGFLIQAIAICKLIMHIDPTQKDMEAKLADLYSKRGVGGSGPGAKSAPDPMLSQKIVAPQVEVKSGPSTAPAKPGAQSAQAQPAAAKPSARHAQQEGEKKLSVAEILAMTPRKKQGATPPPKPAPEPAPVAKEPAGPKPIEIPADDEDVMPEIEVTTPAKPVAAKKPAKQVDDFSTSLNAPIDMGPPPLAGGGGMPDLPPMDMPMGGSSDLPPMDMPVDAEPPSDEVDVPLEDEGVEIDMSGAEEMDIPVDMDEEVAPEIVEEPEEVVETEAAIEPEAELSDDNDEFDDAAAEAELEELSDLPPAGEALLDDEVIEDLGLFPDIPLFKDLDKDQFQSVVRRLQERSVSKGELIVREGDEGDSIFIVAGGSVSIFKEADRKKIHLGTLNEGDFFGEFGYFSGAKRQASAEAAEEVELLEMSREDMDAVVAEFPSVEDVLEKFYQERVMENILATSNLFREMTLEERRKVSGLFAFEEYREGDDIVKEGAEGDAMYLIRAGNVSVHTTNPMGESVSLAELAPGDFFGEVSLVQGKPRTATVSAATPIVELMRLGKDELDSIVSEYPEVLVKIKLVIEKRVEATVNKVSILDLDEDDLDMGSLL